MKIKNWNDFQHFKDRNPPWVKLHKSILDQRDINMISDRSFRVLVCLWLIASEDKSKQGNLPDVGDIAFRLRMDESDINQALTELGKWVDGVDDIMTISERYQDDDPEKRREETEAYTEKSTTAHSPKGENATSRKVNNYPESFEEAWSLYPKRAGGNPKTKAYKAWKARLRDGNTEVDMIEGVKRYHNFCLKTDKIETELVKQASTFFGPDEHFLEDWALTKKQVETIKPAWARLPRNDDDLWNWAKRHDYPGPGTLTYIQYRSMLQKQIDRRMAQTNNEFMGQQNG